MLQVTQETHPYLCKALCAVCEHVCDKPLQTDWQLPEYSQYDDGPPAVKTDIDEVERRLAALNEDDFHNIVMNSRDWDSDRVHEIDPDNLILAVLDTFVYYILDGIEPTP